MKQLQEKYEISYLGVVDRLFALDPKLLSATEVRLLHCIAYYIHKGVESPSVSVLGKAVDLEQRRTRTVISALQDKGVLRVRRSMRTVRFNEINHYEIDFTGPLGEQNMSLNMPKATIKSVAKDETGVGRILPTYIISTNKEKQIHKCITRSARQFDTIENSLEAVAVRITRKRAEKVAKATVPGSQLTFAGVKATWATVMLKYHPTVPALSFSAKDFAIFKMKVQPLLASCSLIDFFDYIVSSWEFLRKDKFGFLIKYNKSLAIAPSLPEVMKYWKIFAQGFINHRMTEGSNERKTTLSDTDILSDKLAKAEHAGNVARREAEQLRDKLARTERIAYATRKEEAPVLSLSAKRKIADDAYTPDDDLPDWSSHDKR